MKCLCGCPISNPAALIALSAALGAAISAGLAQNNDESTSTPKKPPSETRPMPDPEQAAASEKTTVSFAPTAFFTPDIDTDRLQKATFGGGCFWGVEATYRNIEGVTHTAVGFSGGTVDDPSYAEVCNKGTGHAEVVVLLFDPATVSYEDLLGVFWQAHDPTQVDRQGPDVGEQYRSVIFVHDEKQQELAEASKQTLQTSPKYAKRPLATQIEPVGQFFKAEDYHQQYLEKRGKENCHVPGS